VIKCPQSANPKELPLKIMSLGVTISTTIGVTENYQSHSHFENDSLFSMISQFKRKYYVHNHCEFNACMVSLLFPFKGWSFLDQNLHGCEYVGDATFIGGKFVIMGYKFFFQPRHGIIFLLKTRKIWHFTNGINGHALQYACVFYVSKKTYAWYLRCQNELEVYQANVEAKKKEGNNIKRKKHRIDQ